MASASDFAARGKVVATTGGVVHFAPHGTNYVLHLAGTYSGPLNVPVWAHVRTTARKVLTVPTGGGFIAPIFGTPKTIQGRVLFADERTVVIKAGCPVTVTLPGDDAAIDLNDGSIAVGHMVNTIVLPGAAFELAAAPVGA